MLPNGVSRLTDGAPFYFNGKISQFISIKPPKPSFLVFHTAFYQKML